MIASMTGFGRSVVEEDARQIEVELKSVNHRFLKLSSKIPSALSGLEGRLESLVREHVSRGAITLSLRYQDPATRARHRLVPETVNRYLEEATELHHQVGAELPSTSSLLLRILSLPGTVDQEETQGVPEEAVKLVERAVQEALLALIESRGREGSHLEQTLLEHGRVARSLVEQARERAEAVPGEHRDRLIERVKRLLTEIGANAAEISESDLHREVCILSERLDVTEEIKRLEGHLTRLVETLEKGGPVGRPLDFLIQEMHREANTLSTKANDSELTHLAVDLKVEIERMREQVQNLE